MSVLLDNPDTKFKKSHSAQAISFYREPCGAKNMNVENNLPFDICFRTLDGSDHHLKPNEKTTSFVKISLAFMSLKLLVGANCFEFEYTKFTEDNRRPNLNQSKFLPC